MVDSRVVFAMGVYLEGHIEKAHEFAPKKLFKKVSKRGLVDRAQFDAWLDCLRTGDDAIRGYKLNDNGHIVRDGNGLAMAPSKRKKSRKASRCVYRIAYGVTARNQICSRRNPAPTHSDARARFTTDPNRALRWSRSVRSESLRRRCPRRQPRRFRRPSRHQGKRWKKRTRGRHQNPKSRYSTAATAATAATTKSRRRRNARPSGRPNRRERASRPTRGEHRSSGKTSRRASGVQMSSDS